MINNRYVAVSPENKREYLSELLNISEIYKKNVQFVNSLGLTNTIDQNFYDLANNRVSARLVGTAAQLQDRIYKMIEIMYSLYNLFDGTILNLINSGMEQEKAIKKGDEMAKKNFMKIIKDMNLDKPSRQEILFIKSLQLSPSQEKREIAKLNYNFN